MLAYNSAASVAVVGSAAVAVNNYTPLQCAAKGGHVSAVLLLLAAQGVEPNAVDNDNKRVLHRRAL